MKIEKATKEDLNSLLLLEAKTFKSSESPLSKRAFNYHIKNKKNLFYVAKIENNLIGYILILFPRGEYARIYSLAIDFNFKSLGIASKLLSCSLQKIKEKNKKGVVLEVKIDNTPAINLYKKFNFSEVKILKNYYENIDGVKMKLNFLNNTNL